MLTIRHAALTDAGRHKNRNEDRFIAQPEFGLFFVTDGMANVVTPDLVVETLPAMVAGAFGDVRELESVISVLALQVVLCDCNRLIRDKLAEIKHTALAGATLVLAFIRGERALLAHMGDSRIYLHRAGRLEQLTRDHSFVQLMLDQRQITAEDAAAMPTNGGPTRFMGMPERASADVQVLELRGEDRLLLCSDGLTERLSLDDLQAILNKPGSLDATCRHLVDAALAAGGSDNITVLLVAADER